MFIAGTAPVALIAYFMLWIIFALILAVIIALFDFDSSLGVASLACTVFGIAVYLINFDGMSELFPWFADARGCA